MEHFDEDLKRLGIHEVVRATCYGIEVSVPNFYAIFELYCLTLGTFFTPVREIGLALQEMWEVSNLPIGSLPYENFPRTVELEQLEKEDSALFETYQELMCHFYIGLDVYHVRGNVNGLKC